MDARYLLFVFGLFSCISVSSLPSAQQLYCPGRASINCSTATPVIWDGTAFNEQCPPPNAITFQEPNIGGTFSCGELSVTITNVVTIVDGGFITTQVNSSLFFNAQPSLNRLAVRCRTAGASDDVNVVLLVPDILISGVSVSQNSLTAVTVTLTVEDSRCASLYFVEITQMDSGDPPIFMNSSSSSINVAGLDLCRNRYSVVGFVEAPSGLQGGRSKPQEIHVDLSVLRGINNVRGTTTLEWDQKINTQSDCIAGYIISWPGGSVIKDGTTTVISATELNANDNFPYCLTIIVTVTPNTPVGPLTSGASSASVLFQDPGLVAPVISAGFFIMSNGSFQITVSWQPISINEITVERVYGFVKVGVAEYEPRFGSGNSGSRVVPGARPGDQYLVCVKFVSNECMVSATINGTVPPVVFNETQTTLVCDTGFSITVTLPSSPPMSLDSLSILATIDPPHASAVLADYPTSSQQYTVTFDGLTPETTYTYDIRVVLRNDNTTTIGLPVTGFFTIKNRACGTVCVIVVIVVSAVLLVVAVLSLAGGFGAYKYKNRTKDWSVRSSKSENAEKHELTSPLPSDSLYADPKSIEHQAALGTEDQYTIVDKKGKKNTKPEPTPPEALYQDPSTIEHETAASRVMYTVVDDKPSKKKEWLCVASEGLTYAEPGSDQQAAQQPGGYPVEYSSVEHGSTS